MANSAKSVTPLLLVYDVRRSVDFYRDVLGFEVISKHEPDGHLFWAMLKLGGAVIMVNNAYEDDIRPPLAEHAGPRGTTLYFACDNADAVYDHIRSKGWAAQEPQTAFYGMRQVSLVDPDGFQLVFQHAVNA